MVRRIDHYASAFAFAVMGASVASAFATWLVHGTDRSSEWTMWVAMIAIGATSAVLGSSIVRVADFASSPGSAWRVFGAGVAAGLVSLALFACGLAIIETVRAESASFTGLLGTLWLFLLWGLLLFGLPAMVLGGLTALGLRRALRSGR